jgi:hypothetical protein
MDFEDEIEDAKEQGYAAAQRGLTRDEAYDECGQFMKAKKKNKALLAKCWWAGFRAL